METAGALDARGRAGSPTAEHADVQDTELSSDPSALLSAPAAAALDLGQSSGYLECGESDSVRYSLYNNSYYKVI